ncbi:pantothenate kinase [Flavobacterium sp. 316]|uniref:type III pantothenate kinase n=1 Tax=Flavobacterium sp. 316 TaxID=1603293 RepID=UPI0005E6AC2B|nr:type III pantothenate kinase [Flavobacterium sp. 316]KIX20996.1 pantothenate kinase [Flavobacterium sp. 316]
MLLTIDIGNTRIKCAVFENNMILYQDVFLKEEALKKIEKIFNDFPKISNSISSSVGILDNDCFNLIKNNSDLMVVTPQTKLPFSNKYSTPLTLGIDRIVLMAGAAIQFPNKNCLIIDAGTCITYDFIDDENNYFGGAISPGINLRYNSLHNYTAKLPLLKKELPGFFIGNSTNESIHSGIINGVIHEIEGFASQYFHKYTDLTIILTGGDADFLAKRLKSTIFANSNFLIESLSLLFTYVQTEND